MRFTVPSVRARLEGDILMCAPLLYAVALLVVELRGLTDLRVGARVAQF